MLGALVACWAKQAYTFGHRAPRWPAWCRFHAMTLVVLLAGLVANCAWAFRRA